MTTARLRHLPPIVPLLESAEQQLDFRILKGTQGLSETNRERHLGPERCPCARFVICNACCTCHTSSFAGGLSFGLLEIRTEFRLQKIQNPHRRPHIKARTRNPHNKYAHKKKTHIKIHTASGCSEKRSSRHPPRHDLTRNVGEDMRWAQDLGANGNTPIGHENITQLIRKSSSRVPVIEFYSAKLESDNCYLKILFSFAPSLQSGGKIRAKKKKFQVIITRFQFGRIKFDYRYPT